MESTTLLPVFTIPDANGQGENLIAQLRAMGPHIDKAFHEVGRCLLEGEQLRSFTPQQGDSKEVKSALAHAQIKAEGFSRSLVSFLTGQCAPDLKRMVKDEAAKEAKRREQG